MKKACLAVAAAAFISLGAIAGDEEICLDCHEPAEDWEGMSVEEILKSATDSDIKRHSDNVDFDEAQLKAMIEALLKQ
jgi:hypothetical protein